MSGEIDYQTHFTFSNMEEGSKNNIKLDYPVVQFGKAFYVEMLMIPYNTKGGRVFPPENAIWEYIPTTTLRLYWTNKETWIHKLVEIKWENYLLQNLFYPNTSFRDYLLNEKWGADFSPETVDMEIKIWFNIRNKILQ